jgi:hypothetical protein
VVSIFHIFPGEVSGIMYDFYKICGIKTEYRIQGCCVRANRISKTTVKTNRFMFNRRKAKVQQD